MEINLNLSMIKAISETMWCERDIVLFTSDFTYLILKMINDTQKGTKAGYSRI